MKPLTRLQAEFLAIVQQYPGITASEIMKLMGKDGSGGRDMVNSICKKGCAITEGVPRDESRANGIGLYPPNYQAPKGEYLGVFGVVKNNKL